MELNLNKVLTTSDLEILTRQSPDILVRWWCLLNNWQWPKELFPTEKPDLNRVGSESRRTQIMDYINKKVGNRYCLLEWNREEESVIEQFWESKSQIILAQTILCPLCCAFKRVRLTDQITNYKFITWEWCGYHSSVEVRLRESRERNQNRKRR